MVVSINSERNCSWVRGLQERGRRKEGEGERGGLGRGNVWLEESKEGGNDDREGWLEKGWGSWRKVREGLEGKDSKRGDYTIFSENLIFFLLPVITFSLFLLCK